MINQKIECLDCPSYRYCTVDSCINDIELNENDYRNMEIVENE